MKNDPDLFLVEKEDYPQKEQKQIKREKKAKNKSQKKESVI